MTQLSIESLGSRLPNNVPPSTVSSGKDYAMPRFNLKKRTVSGERRGADLPTVNSAFLSGLFADVAKVQDETNSSDTLHDIPSDSLNSDPRFDDSKSCKKTRLSKTKSMTRCGKSFKLLADDDVFLQSPTDVSSTYFFPSKADAVSIERQDSLYDQLCSISTSSSTGAFGAIEAVQLAFPQLPSSVSSTSCSRPLPRKVSELQINESDPLDSPKESYGWFVEMDNDEDSSQTTIPYSSSTSRDLAFSAPTAPKAMIDDAEVEWAQAADTVDEVLGDFF